MRQLFAAFAAAFLAPPAYADAPRVAADIAPVHALVAQVMQGVGVPDLVVSPAASPHGYALRPSQARALQAADLVVWIGPALTPWLAKPIATLAPQAVELELLAAPETLTLPLRDGHAGHDDDEHGGHDAAAVDPHAWLDPQNGRAWLGVIAEALAGLDPDRAALYRANAAAGAEQLDRLDRQTAQRLAPVAERRFVTFHDGYQYFEARYGLQSVGAVTPSDARSPGPAQLAALRDRLASEQVRCAFAEPQFDSGLLATAAERADLIVFMLDPLGGTLEPGAGLYPELLRKMADSMAECLGG